MRPDIAQLSTCENFTESRIEQIYLEAPHGRTRRIRSRERDGVCVYTETEKLRIDGISALETESEITRERYLSLKERIRADSRPINKTRYTFLFGDHLFEVDVYPEWQRCAVMEVELPSRETEVELPCFVEVVKEVTGDKKYSNSSMASIFPSEPI